MSDCRCDADDVGYHADDLHRANKGASVVGATNRAALVTRAALTLWCHYYPEGEWGWMVLVSAFISNVLTAGMQASWFVLAARHGRSIVAHWPSSPPLQGTGARRRNSLINYVYCALPDSKHQQIWSHFCLHLAL